jgi:hypothetical protein
LSLESKDILYYPNGIRMSDGDPIYVDLRASIQKHFADLIAHVEIINFQDPDHPDLIEPDWEMVQSALAYKVNRSAAILTDAIVHYLPPYLFEEFLKMAKIEEVD